MRKILFVMLLSVASLVNGQLIVNDNIDGKVYMTVVDGKVAIYSWDNAAKDLWIFEDRALVVGVDIYVTEPIGYSVLSYTAPSRDYTGTKKFAATFIFRSVTGNYLCQIIDEDKNILFEKEGVSAASQLNNCLLLYDSEHTMLVRLPGAPVSQTSTKSDVVGVQHLEVYPNPAIHVVNIETSALGVAEIYNQQGVVVDRVDVSSGQIEVDSYTPGIYYVKVEGKTIPFVKK